MTALLISLAILLATALAAAALRRSARMASLIGAAGAAAGALAGLAGTLPVLLEPGASAGLRLPLRFPIGAAEVGVDPLSAFFLAPVLVLGGLAAIYGRAYLGSELNHGAGRIWAAYNAFLASLVLLLLARDAALFLFAWEGMAVTAWVLVSHHHEQPEVRRAGYVFLAASHVGGALVTAAFLLLGRGGTELGFAALAAAPRPGAAMAMAVFLLALAGFGLKAGLAPLHFWLPEAHAAAPSHASALLSGVMIKMGYYGLLRILGLFAAPALAGPLLLTLGLATAFIGAALAVSSRDLKRALAYSTIENAGLIAIGLGLGLWGVVQHSERLAALGFAAALLHVWNHALLKGAVFLAAGSVVHATGTRDLERLGGLLKRMPVTATGFVLGAGALAGLPPMNAFLSELLLYLGLTEAGLRVPGAAGLVALVAAGILALIGGLAALAWVRLAGIALLGTPRSAEAERAHERRPAMTSVIVLLLALAVAMALAPGFVAELAWPAIAQAIGDELLVPAAWLELDGLPWGALGAMNLGLWLAIAASAGLLWSLRRGRPEAEDQTWGCGYLGPTPRMQYTGRGFAWLALDRVLPGFLRPRLELRAPQGMFPGPGALATEHADPVTRALLEPAVERWAGRFSRLRMAQQGNVLLYIAYVFAAVVAGFGWLMLRGGKP